MGFLVFPAIAAASALVLLTGPRGQAAEDAAGFREAMWRATAYMQSISTDGGWVWNYSLDLKRRAGEHPAGPEHVWLQPPGTPSVAQAILRAYIVTRDGRFLEIARAAAELLGRCQLPSGGWHYSSDRRHPELNREGELDFRGRAFVASHPGEYITPLYRTGTSYDDNTTQSVLHFLISYAAATKTSAEPRDRAIHATLERAFASMWRAQYPNGAWPQRLNATPVAAALAPPRSARIPASYPKTWPRDPDYVHYYTLNDDVQGDCIRVMLKAWTVLGDSRALDAARRAGDFLIRAQLPAPQSAWAQQYDYTMAPAWARAFEPPAISAAETGATLRALIELYVATGDAKYVAPLRPAVAWLEKSALGEDQWARFYELGTNRPIYGDVDGRIHYTLAEISAKRRTGYGWQGSFKLPAVLKNCRDVLSDSEGYRRLQSTRETKSQRRGERLRAAQEAVAGLDAEGRWVTLHALTKRAEKEQVVSTAVFINRLNDICAYLETSDQSHNEPRANPGL